MIITSIRAENVLKYRSLVLEDLPEQGVIAISGKNESGKSTIGETVCFALFGRTFSLSENELDKVVRWGSGGCSVSMSFRVGSDDHYLIERFLDSEGTHSAKFSRVGEEDLPIARGVDGVADALFMVLGYEYNEFVDSFYLAQREITAPQPHSHTVKAMAGIAALEYVNEQFAEEIAVQDDIVSMSRFRSDEIEAELQELAIEDGHLEALQQEREQVRSAETENTDKIDTLRVDSAAYHDSLPDIQAARGSISRNSAIRFLLLIAAVLAGSAWGLLTQLPEHQLTLQLQTLINTHLPAWDARHLQGLGYLAIALAVLFVFSQLRIMSLKSRLRDLMLVAGQSAQTLCQTHEHSVVLGDSLLDRPEPAQTVSAGSDDADLLEPENTDANADAISPDAMDDSPAISDAVESGSSRPTDDEIRQLAGQVEEAVVPTAVLDDLVERETVWLKQENTRLQLLGSNLERAIYAEEQRLKHAARLREENQSLSEKIILARSRIATRELASELLAGANRHMSMEFNNDVRDLVSRTLPLFTEGRYEHLQIDENMTVSVFSGEKRDFLDLEEISSGTQRQIMLALRLALSQELVNRSVEGRQFVFLDEPFAFFDEARTINSLKVLPELSDEITQIFVVAQEFPEENLSGFNRHIECFQEVETI